LQLHPFIAASQNDDIAALRQFDTDAFTSSDSAELIVDRHGSNALHYAAGYGASLEVLDFLIDECKIPLDCTTKIVKHQASSRTPLHWAARNGHLGTCKYLIGRGADPRRGTSDGTTAVHWSLWNEHKETCAYLVGDEVGVDINVLNSFKCNAGHFVGLNGNVDCMRFFAESGGDIR
jgi:ankyrin repeat protein